MGSEGRIWHVSGDAIVSIQVWSWDFTLLVQKACMDVVGFFVGIVLGGLRDFLVEMNSACERAVPFGIGILRIVLSLADQSFETVKIAIEANLLVGDLRYWTFHCTH